MVRNKKDNNEKIKIEGKTCENIKRILGQNKIVYTPKISEKGSYYLILPNKNTVIRFSNHNHTAENWFEQNKNNIKYAINIQFENGDKSGFIYNGSENIQGEKNRKIKIYNFCVKNSSKEQLPVISIIKNLIFTLIKNPENMENYINSNELINKNIIKEMKMKDKKIFESLIAKYGSKIVKMNLNRINEEEEKKMYKPKCELLWRGKAKAGMTYEIWTNAVNALNFYSIKMLFLYNDEIIDRYDYFVLLPSDYKKIEYIDDDFSFEKDILDLKGELNSNMAIALDDILQSYGFKKGWIYFVKEKDLLKELKTIIYKQQEKYGKETNVPIPLKYSGLLNKFKIVGDDEKGNYVKVHYSGLDSRYSSFLIDVDKKLKKK